MGNENQARAGVIPYYLENDNTIKMMFMKPSDARYGGSDWQVAKGKIDSGENPFQAALREGGEELGLFEGNVDGKVHSLGVFLSVIHMFTFRIKDKKMFGDHDSETEAVAWMTPEEFQQTGRDIHKLIVKAAVRKIKKVEQI
jgi:8-oxo-dGTP pyrophosphatase MutT (NUDIX family)